MFEDEHANGDVSPQPHRWFRIRVQNHLAHELEYAAARRHVSVEELLGAIAQAVVTDSLIGAVLDDAR